MTNLLNLLGPILLGVAVAGILLFAKRVLKVPMPKWFLPVAMAAAILGGHLYNDYTWFSRFRAKMPETVKVVETGTTSGPLQPWTYIWPLTDSFAAVDTASLRRSNKLPDMVIADVILLKRYQASVLSRQIADCAGHRTAALPDSTVFDENGMPQDVRWIERSADDKGLLAMCGTGG